MAKRRDVLRFKSDVVQGQGSYVELRSPSWGELQSFSENLSAMEGEEPARPIAAADDDDVIVRADEGTPIDEIGPEQSPQKSKVSGALERQLVALVMDWDWVDGDDRPLPLPKDDPSVVQRLTAREIGFLNDCLIKLITPPKN